MHTGLKHVDQCGCVSLSTVDQFVHGPESGRADPAGPSGRRRAAVKGAAHEGPLELALALLPLAAVAAGAVHSVVPAARSCLARSHGAAGRLHLLLDVAAAAVLALAAGVQGRKAAPAASCAAAACRRRRRSGHVFVMT